MKPIRVLIAEMPRILQEMIASIISSDPRLQIVGRLANKSSSSALAAAIRRTRAEFVIIQERLEEDGANEKAIVVCRCFARALAIDETGNEATLYQLQVKRTPLGEISATTLVNSIADAATESWPLR